TLDSVNHIYLNPDTFELTLIAETAFGCRDTASKEIIVLPSPEANYSINDSSQCLNENLFNFTNLSNLTGFENLLGLNYKWDYGDNTSSSDTSPTKTFSTYDTFNVQLVAISQDGCRDSVSKQVLVLESPQSAFTINNSNQCFNNNLFLMNFSNLWNFGKVVWNLGDSTISTDSSVNHSYKSGGIYPVQMIIENQQGCADTAIKVVTVHPSPIADFSINDSVQCFNENLFLFKSLTGFGTLSGLNYKWDFGDNTISTDTHTVKTFSTVDTFTVQLLAVSPDACRDSISRQVVVLESPKAGIGVNDSSQCLLENEFHFFNLTGLNQAVSFNYSWGFGDSTQSQDSSPLKTYLHADTFLVSLILTTDFDCKDTAYKEVFVRPMPKAAFIINNPSQCLRENNFNFINASSITTGALAYQWYLNDSLCSDSQHFYNLSILQFGNFPIKLLAQSEYHCLDSVQKNIFVNPMPIADFSYSIPCFEKEIQFSDKSQIPQGSINNWKWYFTSNDSSALQHPVFVFNNQGDHHPKLIAHSDSGCVDTVSKTITIYGHAPAVELERVSVVNDKYNLLEWKDPASPIVSAYQIQKSTNFGNFADFKTYPKDSLHLTDFAVFPDQSIYTYQLLTKDSCGHSSEASNIAQTILLQLDSSETFSMLTWSAYEDWKQGIQRYEVQIFNEKIKNWAQLESFVFPNEFTDSITKLSQSNYCYRIAAYRNNDELQSHSNVVCVDTRMNLFVPNAFSPNGDGINDHFQIKGVFINEFNIQIFNRWGEKLFESDDMNMKWDGSFNGRICPVGIYYYQILAKGSENHNNQLSGSISLIR
ncbi:MAG: T9SS type B sorting domain-containing protein, partial [Bacteroidetes bacterium]|nr:T9SS type B sorting domain-containing protein [Bacteroidota bacterium]